MSTITGTVIKESKESKVGIAFSQPKDDSHGPLSIKHIREGGLFSTTDLVPGLTVVSINGVETLGKTAKEAADILREADEGEVTVIAQGTVGKVEKETADVKVGISLLRNIETGDVTVTSLREGGLFSTTDIKVGQKCVTINGKPCPEHTKDAIKLLRDAVGTVTVVTADVAESAPAADDDKVDDAAEPATAPQDPPQESAPEDKVESAPTEEDNKDRDMPEQAPVKSMSEDASPDLVTVDSTTSSKQSKSAKGSWLESMWSICF